MIRKPAYGCRMPNDKKKNVMQFIRIKSAHHKKVPYQKLWQQLSSFWQPIWRKITNSDKFSWSSLWLYQNRFLWESKLGYKSKTFATGFYFLPLKSSGFSFFQSNHKPAQTYAVKLSWAAQSLRIRLVQRIGCVNSGQCDVADGKFGRTFMCRAKLSYPYTSFQMLPDKKGSIQMTQLPFTLLYLHYYCALFVQWGKAKGEEKANPTSRGDRG